MSQMKHVSVPHEYFLKAKNDYADWRFAFFREINQNSFDAGATRIIYTIEDREEGGCRIIALDNGRGMDLITCETKFLALRQSTKTGGNGSTGAFGVAKEIIAFAHDAYTLETRDIRIEGRGGNYQDFTSESYLEGVRLTIDMHDVSSYSMISRLKDWTSMSDFECKVILNGDVLKSSKTRYPHTFDVDFGKISFRESGDPDYHYSRLIVKMNGMAMYSREVYTHGGAFEATLNLNGSSQERLTSNRDSLTGNLESSLTQVLNQLSNNRSHLTLGEPMVFEFNTATHSQQFRRRMDGSSNEFHEQSISALTDSSLPVSKEALSETFSELLEKPRGYSGNRQEESVFTKSLSRLLMKKEHKEFEDTQARIHNAIGEVDESAFPHNWIVRVSANEKKSIHTKIKNLNKINMVRLAYTWQMLVSYVITHCGMIDAYEDDNFTLIYRDNPIKFGFVMDEVKALCVTDDDGVSILINPFKDRDLYNDDFEILVGRAVHEVAHMIAEEHGEYFVNCMEAIFINLRRAMRCDDKLNGGTMKSLERYIKSHIPAGRS